MVIKGTIAGQASGANNPFGFVIDSCLLEGGSGQAVNTRYGGATPNTVQNCFIRSETFPLVFYVGLAPTRSNFNWTLINNTIESAQPIAIQGSNLGVNGIKLPLLFVVICFLQLAH